MAPNHDTAQWRRDTMASRKVAARAAGRKAETSSTSSPATTEPDDPIPAMYVEWLALHLHVTTINPKHEDGSTEMLRYREHALRELIRFTPAASLQGAVCQLRLTMLDLEARLCCHDAAPESELMAALVGISGLLTNLGNHQSQGRVGAWIYPDDPSNEVMASFRALRLQLARQAVPERAIAVGAK
jgi:hypothetical protein